ncbi:hypothetical protein H1R20_g10558, partial [Candolleomyces eurysporus]
MSTLKRKGPPQDSNDSLIGGHGAEDEAGIGDDLARSGRGDRDEGRGQVDREQENRPRKRSKPTIMDVDSSYDHYASIDRLFKGGPDYHQLALNALRISFPRVSVIRIMQTLQRHRGLYVPTHLSLLDEEKRRQLGEEMDQGGALRNNAVDEREMGIHIPIEKSKGKGRELACAFFDEEKRWLDGFLNKSPSHDAGYDGFALDMKHDSPWSAVEDVLNDVDHDNDGACAECGCCFSDFLATSMAQCPNNHKFCQGCLQTYASTRLSTQQNPVLTCIHTSGCNTPFHDSELRRLLPPKLLSLYERLVQRKALREANLVGLEECPFCPWAGLFEDPIERNVLFRCGNGEDGCGIVSCRICKKKNHWPEKNCKQAQEDEHLDGRVMIEEAMSKALVRTCPNPQCEKPFIKEHGCNKMKCPSCGTLSCYTCRQVISGYDHFHQNTPSQPGSSSKNTKCPLWDTNTDQRHQEEVKEACEKALEEYKRDHPEAVFGKNIKVDCAAPGRLMFKVRFLRHSSDKGIINTYHRAPLFHWVECRRPVATVAPFKLAAHLLEESGLEELESEELKGPYRILRLQPDPFRGRFTIPSKTFNKDNATTHSYRSPKPNNSSFCTLRRGTKYNEPRLN